MSKQGSEVKSASAIIFGRLMAERSFIFTVAVFDSAKIVGYEKIC